MRCPRCGKDLPPYELLAHLVDEEGYSYVVAISEVRRLARGLGVDVEADIERFTGERLVAPRPTEEAKLAYIPKRFPKRIAEACRLVLFQPPEILARRYHRTLMLTAAIALAGALVALATRSPAALALMAAAPAPFLLAVKPLRAVSAHYSRLREEGPWALAAAYAYASSGVPVVGLLRRLASKERAMPAVAHEVKRIFSDAHAELKPLASILSREAGAAIERRAGDAWRGLMSAASFLERTGGDPAAAMREASRLAAASLKADLRRQADSMVMLATTFSTVFAVMPPALIPLVSLLAGGMMLPLCMMLALASIMMAFIACLLSDLRSPKLAGPQALKPYASALKALPLGLVAGVAALALGPRLGPLAPASPALAIALGAVAFGLPGYMWFSKAVRGEVDAIERLPDLLRDLADEVRRGSSPLKALEYLATTQDYGGLTPVLVQFVRRAKVAGVEEALKEAAGRVPKPTLLALELIRDLDELGAAAGSFDAFAEAVDSLVEAVKDYRSRVAMTRTTALVGAGAACAVLVAIVGFIMPMFQGFLGGLTAVPSAGVAPIFNPVPVTREEVLAYAGTLLAVLLASLGFAVGKIATMRVGLALRDVAVASAMLVGTLVAGALGGML